MKAAVMEVVGEHFRPEFINRVDELVVFHPLDEKQIRQIAGIQVQYLEKRLADREMGFEIADAALDLLGAAGGFGMAVRAAAGMGARHSGMAGGVVAGRDCGRSGRPWSLAF